MRNHMTLHCLRNAWGEGAYGCGGFNFLSRVGGLFTRCIWGMGVGVCAMPCPFYCPCPLPCPLGGLDGVALPFALTLCQALL